MNLAKGLTEALALTGTPLTSPAASPGAKSDTAKKIEDILGFRGTVKGGVLSVGVPRKDLHITMKGAEIPGSMGMNIPLNFQMDGSKAAINGTFCFWPKK